MPIRSQPGEPWNEDDPHDLPRIRDNISEVLAVLRQQAADRPAVNLNTIRQWHERLYRGCTVPVPGYVSHFRGDPTVPELVGYEVAIGSLPDGSPERVGVWSTWLADELSSFEAEFKTGLAHVDRLVPPLQRPSTDADLGAVLALAAGGHGEWIRLHPFANGNGRLARLLVAFVCLRYSLPVFLNVKPRPYDPTYAIAARASMGLPPDFTGDHAPTVAVFAHLLRAALDRMSD